jgi:hypothetical protein
MNEQRAEPLSDSQIAMLRGLAEERRRDPRDSDSMFGSDTEIIMLCDEVTRLRAALAAVSEERDAAVQEADSRKSALVGVCHFIARQVAASISVVEKPSE